MPTATTRDRRAIHYEQHGDDGPWLVFVQGLSLSGRFWFDIPARVSAARGARALVIDNRGTGRSDRVRAPFTMRTLADDVATVMDHAGCDRATLVGISMGGMISQQVALAHPSRVEALGLLATTPGLPLGRLPSPRTLSLLARLPFTRGRAGGELAAELLLPPGKRAQFETLFARWPAAFAADPQDPRTFFLQLGAIATHSTGSRLPTITAPTVVVAGREDTLVPPVNSERIAGKIPGAELELLEDVGHAIPSEVPTVVDRVVERLWARLGR